MKQPKQKKLSTPYNPKPFVVINDHSEQRSETVTRNSSNFKVVPKHFMQDSSVKKGGVRIPTTFDKTPVLQIDPDDP